MDLLREADAKVKFISFEPLIGSIGKLNLKDVDWVIVGGESGPQARYMAPEWVEEIRDRCLEQHVPFFFKQWGGVNKKKTGRLLGGREAHSTTCQSGRVRPRLFAGHQVCPSPPS